MVTKTLIFTYYKQSIKTIIKIDLSNYIGHRVFSWIDDDGLLHSITFFSNNLNLIEYNF